MKTSCNIATPEFIAQVEMIEPSDTGLLGQHQKHRPCRLILKDGTVIPRAICVEDHRGFTTDGWIHPSAVERVEPSRERMPASLASRIYTAGESGMGYQLFRLRFADGASQVFVTGNVVDFPDYPDGYDCEDAEEVFPHEGRKESRFGYRQSRGCQWCFYVKE